MGMTVIERDIEYAITRLGHLYVQCLDDGRFEDWVEMFVDDGVYIIHPRENVDAGLEGYWMYCSHRGMIRDRIVSLQEANIYNIHYDRHLISNVLVTGREDDCYIVRSNYLVVQTDHEGRSRVFNTGEYRDKVVFVNDIPKFKERIVVADTFNVEGMLAVPL